MIDFQTLLFERKKTKFEEGEILYLAEDGAKRVMVVHTEKEKCLIHYVDEEKADKFVPMDMLFYIHERFLVEDKWNEYASQFLVISKKQMTITEFVNYEVIYVYPKLGAKTLGRVHNVFAAVVNENSLYYKTAGGYAMMKESSDPYVEFELLKEKLNKELKESKCTVFQLDKEPECQNMYFVPVDNSYAEWDYFSLRTNL